MSLSLSAIRAAVKSGVEAHARLGLMTYEAGVFNAFDAAALPMVQLAIPQVPAEQAATDLTFRRAQVELHVIRTGGADIEDQGELDAQAAEQVLLAALGGAAPVISYELQGWEFRPADDGSPRALRTIVTVSATYSESFTAA